MVLYSKLEKKLHTRNTVILKDTNSIKIILTIFCHSIFEDGNSQHPFEKFPVYMCDI